jgi:hypothetical protein
MTIARDSTRPAAERMAALRALADDARRRVVALLGPDLGEAYNTASARAWLDDLELGRVAFIQPNGQRAIFLAGSNPALRQRTAAPNSATVPAGTAPTDGTKK